MALAKKENSQIIVSSEGKGNWREIENKFIVNSSAKIRFLSKIMPLRSATAVHQEMCQDRKFDRTDTRRRQMNSATGPRSRWKWALELVGNSSTVEGLSHMVMAGLQGP